MQIIQSLSRQQIEENSTTLKSFISEILNENIGRAISEKKVEDYYQQILEYSETEDCIIAAYLEMDRILAFIWAYIYDNFGEKRMHSNMIYVDPSHRGRGIATRLIEHLTEIARLRNITSIDAMVTYENSSAMSFHSMNGFKIERVRMVKSISDISKS